jgi:DNA-binding transcriptional LysR family regulator
VDGEIVEFDVNGTVIANQETLLIRAALDGIGSPLISQGRLVPLLQKLMPPPSDGFFLFYPSRRQNSAPLQAMIDFLPANLKEVRDLAKGAKVAKREEA